MDKQEKKVKSLWMIAIIVIVVILIAIVAFMMQHKTKESLGEKVLYVESESGTKTNVSKKLAEEKEIDGLRIQNIELTCKEEVSYLKAEVKNTNKEKSGDFNLNIKLVDESGNEIITIVGYVPEVEAGQTTTLDTAVTADVAGAYNFEVSKVLQ